MADTSVYESRRSVSLIDMANLMDRERRLRAALLATSNPGEDTRAVAAADDEDPVGVDEIDRMLADLETRPAEVMAYAQRTWDRELKGAELRQALLALRAAIELADGSDIAEVVDNLPRDLRSLGDDTRGANAMALGPLKLPDDWWPNRPNIGVTIDTANFQFETDRDWTGWAYHTAKGYVGANVFKTRADFRTGNYDYAVPAGNGTKIALFSDFGTGLYHSQYIAHFIGTRRPHLAFHLGDVYYAGKQDEFDARFDGVLDRHLFAQSPNTKLYCLNGNHEMYSRSRPYFRYLDKLRGAGRTSQEGSYFRLRIGQRFQVVGLDTACGLDGKLTNGRFTDAPLQAWLAARLAEGKREGRSTILLTSDYPYLIGKGDKAPLFRDLDGYVQQGLIDLWFWGDSHYGALYFRSPASPFVGGCLGHGGYPFYRRTPERSAGSLAAPRFVECRTRFHGTDVRADMGNNGFAFLNLDDSTGGAEIEYLDWRDESRCKEPLARTAHGLDFVAPGATRSMSLPPAAPVSRSIRAATDDSTRSAAPAPCPCDETFDAQTAVRDLSRKVTALADALLAREPSSRPVAQLRFEAVDAMARSGSAAIARGGLELLDDDAARMARALALDPDGALARIVGGAPVRSRNFPSCVFLAGPGRQWLCTGVLVAPQVILTAAHCGDGLLEAMLGGSAVAEEGGTDGTVVALRNVVIHPEYGGTRGPDAHRHDIAVAILDQPATLTPVALALDDELAAITTGLLVGYGYNDEAASVGLGVLRWVEVEVGPIKTRAEQDHASFATQHGYTVDTEFVAGRKGLGRDTCRGDSGGPLYVRVGAGHQLAGLTSRATLGHGRPCGDGGIYVRPLKYISWIEQVVRDHGLELALDRRPD